MTPGPKPKQTPKRQTLGVAAEPWLFSNLDQLVGQFQQLQKYVPEWVKCPTTRSSAAAWILERCISGELAKVDALQRELYESIYPVMSRSALPDASMWEEISADPFLDALHKNLKEAALRIHNGSMTHPETSELQIPLPQPASQIREDMTPDT